MEKTKTKKARRIRRWAKMPDNIRNALRSEFRDGATISEIARKYKMSPGIVWKHTADLRLAAQERASTPVAVLPPPTVIQKVLSWVGLR